MFKFNAFLFVFVQNWLLLCVFCQPAFYCPSVSRAHRCARVCAPHGGQTKNLRRFASTDFLSKKLLQIPYQTRFQALDYPGDPAELAAQLCKAPTLLTRTGAPLACWYVACLYQFVHMSHDLNNLSAFSCFFYSYVFMCSLPEAPGMKFSLEFFVVNSLCRTFHRIYILIFLFFQSCQPCEVHNIQVQCRSCTSTICKKKIEFCSTSEFFIVECLAFPTSLIRCCFWGHIVQMLSQQERCRDYLLSIFVRCNPQVEFKLEDKKGFHVSRKLNENIIKV